ncbi:MAG: hypothetical protein WC797_01345 [Candidatus Paceibacterota bacterium]|jgi:hypothetical protein
MNENEVKNRDRPKKPAPEEFSHNSIRREVLKDTIQHPAVILPVALSVVLAMYVCAFGGLGVALTAFASLSSGLAAFIVRAFIMAEPLAKAHAKELMERLRACQDVEAGETIQGLVSECQSLAFPDGYREANELLGSYQKLIAVLKKAESEEADKFRRLADEAFADGIKYLQQAISIHKALQVIDVDKATKDRDKCVKDIANYEKVSDLQRAEVAKRSLENHQKTINAHAAQMVARDRLIGKLDGVEAAMNVATIDLSSRQSVTSDGGISDVCSSDVTQLELAIKAARELEEDLRNGAGGVSAEDGEEYLKASQGAR